MTQHTTPVRDPRLGRIIAATPAAVAGVVLLLPSGLPDSDRRPPPLPDRRTRALARRLAAEGGTHGIAAHVVRYRCRGWNGDRADLAQDAAWAADEAVRRYGDVPVCLAGRGMGGRAALRTAGHHAVTSVLAVAPWLPEESTDAEPEPVRQLAGRQVMIVHGTNDERCDPELSFRLAERAKKSNRDICRFEVHSDGHALAQHRTEVLSLATDFVLGALLGTDFARPVTDAFAAPPPLGLRMPLASGFGRSLRH
ncbi:dienelactone hydrolase family protein [Streptomyces albidoflavus]|uniref:Alpha/beta hydrolase n=2 Tax=Streptomyces TaxID=1883 RepID=A0AB37XDP4_9ACTN|nr:MULTISPECIES: dienelactone hydrolase family protein [Streptomyces]MYX87374.1 alpha/beta hydrolase [Streptomyces sp. SID4915]QLA58696.1 dienelactone hydrolase family protein [Streptomyces violascens]SCE19205.1 Dienelactone hydrolase family protein [Streptomyces sp. IgraMP-1]ALM41310.1 dienelactone hydrolase [Streptomyces sp. FR-008]AMM10672.1 dienelactone hydrolase [Streptomyces albidoflavus]